MKNFFYIALLVLISCSSKTDSNVSDNFHIPIIQPKGSEQYLQLGSDYIFNQDSLHTFELIIPEAFGNFIGYSYNIDWEAFKKDN